MAKDLKYKNYEELAVAYDTGELTAPMTVDNDCCYVYVEGEKVFEGNGPYDFVTVLNLLGIPTQEA